MGDDDRGAAFYHAGQRLADAELGFGVHARGSFIQDEDFRIVRQRTRKRDELFLPGGERAATLAYFLVEPARQRANEVRDVDLLSGILDRLVFNPVRAQADVVRNRAGEEERVLQHPVSYTHLRAHETD